MNISSKSCKESYILYMLLFIKNSLMKMSYTPSLWDIETKLLSKLLSSLLCDSISPSSKWNKQITTFIKGHITVHHSTKSYSACCLNYSIILFFYIFKKILISILQTIPYHIKAISPYTIFKLVLPAMSTLSKRLTTFIN